MASRRFSSARATSFIRAGEIIAARPKSSGRVRLRSADPMAKPVLENIHLSNEADVATLREGIKLGRKICQAPAFDLSS